jgi:hypothetical protein
MNKNHKLKNGCKTGGVLKVHVCDICKAVFSVPHPPLVEMAFALNCKHHHCKGQINQWFTGFKHEIENATSTKYEEWEPLI